MKEKGQVIVLAAALMAALAALLGLVVNLGCMLADKQALDRAVEDAATVALRRSAVGDGRLDAALAVEEARRVLQVELANTRWAPERPDQAAAAASVEVNGGAVSIRVRLHSCPPLWPGCMTLSASRQAELQTTPAEGAPPATPVRHATAPALIP